MIKDEDQTAANPVALRVLRALLDETNDADPEAVRAEVFASAARVAIDQRDEVLAASLALRRGAGAVASEETRDCKRLRRRARAVTKRTDLPLQLNRTTPRKRRRGRTL
jgi:hypothetical protein